jgi:hypothetical protein
LSLSSEEIFPERPARDIDADEDEEGGGYAGIGVECE